MSAHSELHAIDKTQLIKGTISALSSIASAIEIETDDRTRLVFESDPCSLAVERYKLLRRRLCAMNPDGGLILITSPAPGDGKTLTAINLAYCLAEAGHPTCLVDLDFRFPGILPELGHDLLGEDLIDVLTGTTTISEAMQQIGSRPLYLLGMRDRSQTPSPQLDIAVLRPFLVKLRGAFNWIILDLPPAIPFADVSEVLPEVDGALMVVRSGKTKRSLVEPTVDVLGNKLWGVILNDAEVSGGAYYGYYGYGGNREKKRTSRRR